MSGKKIMEKPNMAPGFSAAIKDLNNMSSELRHDLMSAQTRSDLDLELAFNLQMEEAINASIALKPPTSSSSSSSHGLKRRGQEVERLEQERRDREIKKMHDDRNHNRQIHDQKVANGECSRSTAMADENVRVYIKGLVSEERVRDSTIMVAAIGVAIYGSKDNLILEASKPLVDVDKKKSLMDPVEVGFQALIEGLNAVIELGLKSVTCFCDDHRIHQYVTAKLPPPLPGHIDNLFIDTVLLMKKFAKFNMSLVAQNDNKLAFKLARDAIVSQITWASGGGKNLMETCIICFEDTAVNMMFTLDDCLHRFCISCMKQHVQGKMLNGMMAKCPRQGCKSKVNIDRCREFLEPKSVELMRQRIKEASIAVTQRVYCPNPRCSALMSKREVLEYTNKYMGKARQSGERKCTECRGNFCINCKVTWHNSMTCDAYKRSNLYQSAEDAKLKSLATEKLWRQCVKCSHMVELREGCYHIRCRCGYEFCYTCGAEWKNKKATCTCPLWGEEYIMDNHGEEYIMDNDDDDDEEGDDDNLDEEDDVEEYIMDNDDDDDEEGDDDNLDEEDDVEENIMDNEDDDDEEGDDDNLDEEDDVEENIMDNEDDDDEEGDDDNLDEEDDVEEYIMDNDGEEYIMDNDGEDDEEGDDDNLDEEDDVEEYIMDNDEEGDDDYLDEEDDVEEYFDSDSDDYF